MSTNAVAVQEEKVEIVGHPLIFARRAGAEFIGVARCECSVEYTTFAEKTPDAAAKAAAEHASADGWDASPPDRVVCPWCLESAGEWPE